MRRIALAFVLVTLMVTAYAGDTRASDTETLTGEFVWNNEGQSGALEAIFTGTSRGHWDVSFHFVWEDQAHTWVGTAEGSLTDGDLRGSVVTDHESKGTFVFEGTFKGGKFTGTHASMRGGERQDTGTMTLMSAKR